jgi:hypothetical protein
MTCPFCITPCGTKWCPYTEDEDMKRSDLKKLIFEKLELTYSHPEGNAKLAEEILQTIEGAKMLPPIAQLSKLGISDNAWEPEDEAK